MLRVEILTNWNILKEQITNKFYQLQKTNYDLERSQSEFINQVQHFDERPIDNADQAINILSHLKRNYATLAQTDWAICQTLKEAVNIFRIIGPSTNEVHYQEAKELRQKIIELTPVNKLLTDYQQDVLQLIDLIWKIKYGTDPNDTDSGPTIEEVD